MKSTNARRKGLKLIVVLMCLMVDSIFPCVVVVVVVVGVGVGVVGVVVAVESAQTFTAQLVTPRTAPPKSPTPIVPFSPFATVLLLSTLFTIWTQKSANAASVGFSMEEWEGKLLDIVVFRRRRRREVTVEVSWV